MIMKVIRIVQMEIVADILSYAVTSYKWHLKRF